MLNYQMVFKKNMAAREIPNWLRWCSYDCIMTNPMGKSSNYVRGRNVGHRQLGWGGLGAHLVLLLQGPKRAMDGPKRAGRFLKNGGETKEIWWFGGCSYCGSHPIKVIRQQHMCLLFWLNEGRCKSWRWDTWTAFYSKSNRWYGCVGFAEPVQWWKMVDFSADGLTALLVTHAVPGARWQEGRKVRDSAGGKWPGENCPGDTGRSEDGWIEMAWGRAIQF